MLELSVYCIAKTPHLSMPVTGLLMLAEQKKVCLSIEIDGQNRKRLPYAPLLEVCGRGKRVLFDLADGYGWEVERAQPQLASQADMIFRRSFSPEKNQQLLPELLNRVRPLGFHFHVSYPGNPIDQPSSWRERRRDLFQRTFNGAPRSYFTPDKFERGPVYRKKPAVLFYTRLWHAPEGDELYESVVQLNLSRIKLVSELKKRYGPRFTGGIQFDPKEVGRCGGLMVGIGATSRKRYLETMHKADICIGSTGLHNSIGWKTAEDVAASKAIVNEAFCFQVPGNFRAGVNYLPFADVEGCLTQVERLMGDPQRIYEMALANQAYYQASGRPDRVMANALRQVFPELEGREETL